MKTETKVAWLKDDPINASIEARLRAGEHIPHAELIAAVGDRDGQRVFKGNQLVDTSDGPSRSKSDFVVFEYQVYLRNAQDRVAVFHRSRWEEHQDRITSDSSVLLGSSSPQPPALAVPATLHDSVCTDSRMYIGSLEPRGLVWNPLPPEGDRARPTYLTAIYEHRWPDELRLFGRWKHSPDRLLEWLPASKMGAALRNSGLIDRTLGHALTAGAFGAVDKGAGRLVYSPESRLTVVGRAPEEFDALEYSHGRNVFISHAAEDAFAAFALHRFLVEESSRAIYPTVDLTDLRDGERTSRIPPLVEACDALVVIITPQLLEKSRARAESGERDWVREEVELAIRLDKLILGFKLGTVKLPPYLPEGLIANNKAFYTDWQKEIQSLIESVQRRFGS